MSAEQNKQVVQQFHQTYNRGDLEGAAALIASNFTGYVPGAPGPLTRDDFKNMGGAYLSAFPGSRSETRTIIAEGDWVASYGVFSGTHTGDFMGIPATGKPVQFTWIHFFRVSGGKIVELHVEQDTLGMMQQLGVVPA